MRMILILSMCAMTGFSIDNGFEFFPNSVELIAKWDVSSSLAFEGIRSELFDSENDEDTQKLISLGLNPSEDIDDAFFGLENGAGEGKANFIGAIHFNRKIDLGKVIQGFADWKSEQVTIQEYRGTKIFGLKNEDNAIYLSNQLGGEWSLVGSLDLVKQGLDRYKGEGDCVVKNKQLMKISQNGTLPHLFWAAGSFSTPGMGAQYKNVLFTLDYLNGIQIGGRIPFSTEEEKASINQAISMGTGLLMMFSQGHMDPSNIKISESESDISFRVTIPTEVLASLKQQAEAMQQTTEPQLNDD